MKFLFQNFFFISHIMWLTFYKILWKLFSEFASFICDGFYFSQSHARCNIHKNISFGIAWSLNKIPFYAWWWNRFSGTAPTHGFIWFNLKCTHGMHTWVRPNRSKRIFQTEITSKVYFSSPIIPRKFIEKSISGNLCHTIKVA